jgi:hypothetical protein
VPQVGAGDLYGLSDFVLGCDGGGTSACSLFATSEIVQVTGGCNVRLAVRRRSTATAQRAAAVFTCAEWIPPRQERWFRQDPRE